MITNLLVGILEEMPEKTINEKMEKAQQHKNKNNHDVASVTVDRFCTKCGIVGKCFQCQKCGEYFDSRCGKMVKHVCKFCRSKLNTQPSFCSICKGQKDLQQCSGCQQLYHPLCVKENIPQKRSSKFDKLCDRCIRVMQLVPKSLICGKGSVCQICNKGGLLVKCSSCERPYHSFCVEFRDIKKGWHCGHCMYQICSVCGTPLFNGSSVIQCKGRKNSCRKYFHTVRNGYLNNNTICRSASELFLKKRLCATTARKTKGDNTLLWETVVGVWIVIMFVPPRE